MQTSRPDELVAALQACRRHFRTAAVFSLALNVLHLAAPLYMMQVYDRVIASGSETTLLMLTLITLLAFAALAGLDWARAGVLSAASLRLDRMLAGRAFSAMMADTLRTGRRQQQALRDLDTCRQFVCGSGMQAVFDLPWTPLYILITFGLHPALGFFVLISALALVAMAVLSERRVRSLSRDAQARAQSTYTWAETSLRNAHAVHAMSIMPGLLRRWSSERGPAVVQQHAVGEQIAAMSASVRFLRMSMQSLVLGLGAYLVIERATTPGAIFAASLLLGRALQPVEQIIGQWQPMLAARSAYLSLKDLLHTNPSVTAARPVPPALRGDALAAHGVLTATDVGYAIPGRPQPLVSGVAFQIQPGESIGLIGPSGAGKSTLVRLLVGVLQPTSGGIRLGGVDIASLGRQLDVSLLGPAPIGYVPQDIELFGDTIAANISRFGQGPDAEIMRAAQMAGVHEMVMRLPEGYRTQIGEGGVVLSGGMRQRIALARAVFGRPSLVVLDEPSSNLDTIGDQALAQCIRHLKAQRTTVVLVSHRPASTTLMDKFLVLMDGSMHAFGTRAEVVRRLSAARSVPAGGAMVTPNRATPNQAAPIAQVGSRQVRA